MEVLYPRCAGLDVHKDVIVAAVRCVSVPRHHEVRSFATTTSGLLALSEWLASHGCTHLAMEATDVYWKPMWHVLEGEFELVLASAQHVRNVPGRKTDVSDAAWIADLLAHGLIRSSFVPPAPIQELRDLTRTRKQPTREIAQHTLRLQKILEEARVAHRVAAHSPAQEMRCAGVGKTATSASSMARPLLPRMLDRTLATFRLAILAVAASMLNAAYFILRDHVDYHDLGSHHFDRFDRRKTIRRLVRRLEDLGCQVEITAHAA
jgi:transposase